MAIFGFKRKDTSSKNNDGGLEIQNQVKEMQAEMDKLQRRLATLTEDGGETAQSSSASASAFSNQQQQQSTLQSQSNRDLIILPPQLNHQKERRGLIPPPSFQMEVERSKNGLGVPRNKKKKMARRGVAVRAPDASRFASVGPDVLQQIKNASPQKNLKPSKGKDDTKPPKGRLAAIRQRFAKSEKPSQPSTNKPPPPPSSSKKPNKSHRSSQNRVPAPSPPPKSSSHPLSPPRPMQRPPSKILVPIQVTESVCSSENSFKEQKRDKAVRGMVSTETRLSVDAVLQRLDSTTSSLGSKSLLSSRNNNNRFQQQPQQQRMIVTPPRIAYPRNKNKEMAFRPDTEEATMQLDSSQRIWSKPRKDNSTNYSEMKRINVVPTHATAAAASASAKSKLPMKDEQYGTTGAFKNRKVTAESKATSSRNKQVPVQAPEIHLQQGTFKSKPSIEQVPGKTKKTKTTVRVVKARRGHQNTGMASPSASKAKKTHRFAYRAPQRPSFSTHGDSVVSDLSKESGLTEDDFSTSKQKSQQTAGLFRRQEQKSSPKPFSALGAGSKSVPPPNPPKENIRANLMGEILQSKNKKLLKPVNSEGESPSSSSGSAVATLIPKQRHINPHDNIMAGIRAGINLKKVPVKEKAVGQSSASSPPPNPLLAQLQARKKECLRRQLQQQGSVMQDDDWTQY